MEDTEAPRDGGGGGANIYCTIFNKGWYLLRAMCQHCYEEVTCINLFSPHDHSMEAGNTINSVEQMRNGGTERLGEKSSAAQPGSTRNWTSVPGL